MSSSTSHKKQRVTHVTRAKVLPPEQFHNLLGAVRRGDHALRNEVLLRLSFNAGLRAQEIAGLQWRRHILGPIGEVGDVIRITRDIAKGANRTSLVERDVPLKADLIQALTALRFERPDDVYVIYALKTPVGSPTKRGVKSAAIIQSRSDNGGCDPNTLVQYFRRLYAAYGFDGLTSHSGRRSFITAAARNTKDHNTSLRDIQQIVGHRKLETTAGYIDPSPGQRALVGALY